MLESIVTGIDDRHSLRCCIDRIMMADISGDQHLHLFCKGMADHAAACPGRYCHAFDRCFYDFASVYQSKGEVKCLLYLLCKLPKRQRLP